MNANIVLIVTGLVALLLGLLLGWWLSRKKAETLAQVTAAEAKAAAQVEVATLTERLSSTMAGLQSERQRHLALQQASEGWRTALDEASNEIAKLTERSSRVPTLEAEAVALTATIEGKDAELLQLSTANATNSEKAEQLAQQLTEQQTLAGDLQQKLDAAAITGQLANEAKAAFEQQAVRVPSLEAQLGESRTQLDAIKAELSELRESSSTEAARLSEQLSAEREALVLAREELGALRANKETLDARVGELTSQLTELRTHTDGEREHAAEKLQLLMDAREVLTDQFKTLATDILEEKSKRFAEQNQTSIGQLLEPLKTQLSEFKGKVEEVYVQESNGRAALSEQVKSLVTLNQTLSQDAKNLTLALKGQAKTQGNWGELILERVLEASGLKKGHEYKVQDSQVREDGTRAQPDVVIELPEERKLVVDAKVSLVAYDRYVSAGTDEERVVALREHLASVRGHIKGLSEKKYHALYGLQSLDFVLAFVPIEPAFMLAVTNDNDLFMDAWQRNVLLVSPSTLLFVVRTVAHLWRQEAQSRNSQEIAERGAALYDKLSGFVADLQKVGDRLRLAKEAFDDAQGKLSTGKGNVIRQAEMLRELGVKPTKALPAPLVQAATSHDDIVVPDLAALTAPLVNETTEGSRDPLQAP